MEPVKVGVVGIGSMGVHHARVYSELPNTELIGLVDIDETRGKLCSADFNTTFFSDYRTLIEKGVQAVNIAVPTSLHYPLAVDFIENGVHVLVEKPLWAEDGQAIQELETLARANETACYTAYNHRFEPHFVRMRDLISSGEYPVSRSLFFYTKNAHIEKVKGMEDYVDMFLSDQMVSDRGYLKNLGLIPLPADRLKAERSEWESRAKLKASDLKG